MVLHSLKKNYSMSPKHFLDINISFRSSKIMALLIKAMMTYYGNTIGPLFYLLMKALNFIKRFLFPWLLFLWYSFLNPGFFLYFHFPCYFCSSGLTWHFLFMTKFYFLVLIEFLLLFLPPTVQLTLM